MHEKILNIIRHQANSNSNDNMIPPKADNTKDWRDKERQESHSLFRGMKNGTATLKDSLTESSVSHKTKYSPTKQFSNLTYKHFPN